jgi:hypothetical protein
LSWSSRCSSLPASLFNSVTAVPCRRRRIRAVLPCCLHHQPILAAEILFIYRSTTRFYTIQESSQISR